MPFQTTNVGGSWTGGGTEAPNCSDAAQRAIRQAFDFVHTVAVPMLRNTSGLEAVVDGLVMRTVDSVLIDCGGADCSGESGSVGASTDRIGGNQIRYCPNVLPGFGRQLELNIATFHELIHLCGGSELDAYGLSLFVFNDHATQAVVDALAGSRASNPRTDVFTRETADIDGGMRASAFLIWEPDSTGNLFVKIQSGSTWNGSPIWAAGMRLGRVVIRRTTS